MTDTARILTKERVLRIIANYLPDFQARQAIRDADREAARSAGGGVEECDHVWVGSPHQLTQVCARCHIDKPAAAPTRPTRGEEDARPCISSVQCLDLEKCLTAAKCARVATLSNPATDSQAPNIDALNRVARPEEPATVTKSAQAAGETERRGSDTTADGLLKSVETVSVSPVPTLQDASHVPLCPCVAGTCNKESVPPDMHPHLPYRCRHESPASTPSQEGRAGELRATSQAGCDNTAPSGASDSTFSGKLRTLGSDWSAAALTKENATLILSQQEGRCFYCAKPFERLDPSRVDTWDGYRTVIFDHLIPRRVGGQHGPENRVAACPRCDGRKGSRLPTLEEMHKKGEQFLRRQIGPKPSGDPTDGGWIWLDHDGVSEIEDNHYCVWLPDGHYIAGRRVGTEGDEETVKLAVAFLMLHADETMTVHGEDREGVDVRAFDVAERLARLTTGTGEAK